MKNSFRKMMILVTAFAMVLMFTGCDSDDYKEAMGLYESGNYAEAMEMFQALGDYEDSAQMVLACRYGQAKVLMDAGSYEEAAQAFALLGDYQDSQAQMNACKYAVAVAYMDSGDYEAAEPIFQELGDYENSAVYLSHITGYKEANALLEAGKYSEAAEAFEQLGDFQDSREQASACWYAQAEAYLNQGDYEAAEPILRDLGDYENSAAYLRTVCGMKLVKYLQEKGPVVCDTSSFTKVTMKANGDDGIVIEYSVYMYGMGMLTDGKYTVYITVGKPEAELHGSHRRKFQSKNNTQDFEEKGVAVWKIDTYRQGDTVTWTEYTIEGTSNGHTCTEADGHFHNAKIFSGTLWNILEDVQKLMTQNSMDITLADLGFASVTE
ncbi:MAG: tetratricopeptide repeat protein [Oscillospiraceae bacterium]|nr:tetratricopeptide repeat protein [Oscillospiraceae bacterium]